MPFIDLALAELALERFHAGLREIWKTVAVIDELPAHMRANAKTELGHRLREALEAIDRRARRVTPVRASNAPAMESISA